jgi:hypothetical protein
VNPEGGVVATFTVDSPSIRLLDATGKELWSAGGNPVRKLALK